MNSTLRIDLKGKYSMKTLVLVFHPHRDQSRVNARLAAQAEQQENVTVRYLYDLYPDFRIDVAAEQKALEDAERIVLQFPIYWYSSPALLKQWEDDVLSYGWAYGSTGTALHGKELVLAVSPGAQAENYSRDGLFKYSVTELLRPFQATSNLIGTKFLPPFITAGAASIEDRELEEQVEAYASYLTAEHAALSDFE